MRDILFRGKRTNNGEWIYGDLVHANHRLTGARFFEIWTPLPDGEMDPNKLEYGKVDPATIGQMTGASDKNWKPIFEGDIIKVKHFFTGTFEELAERKIRNAYGKSMETPAYVNQPVYFRNYVVEYSEKNAMFIARNGSDQKPLHKLDTFWHEREVIGNIYDNPDLLEVKETV